MNSIIQILRGQRDSLKKQKANITLEDGQLLYNKTDNYISVGNSLDSDNSLLKDPIAVKELHGNISEDLQPKDDSNPYGLGQYDYILKHNGEDLYLNNKIGAVKIHSETEVQVLNEITESSSDEAVIRNKELKAVKKTLKDFEVSHNNIENNGENGSALKDSNNDCKEFKSFLYGDHLTATADYQAVFGQYNDTSSDALLVVGGGTSDEGKNLFEVNSKASKFNTKLNISEPPTEDKDALRWGDLKVKQVSDLNSEDESSEGNYIDEIKFVGDTLRYTKKTLPSLSVTSSGFGKFITKIETSDHNITCTFGAESTLGTYNSSTETAEWVVYKTSGHTLYTCSNLKLSGNIEASSFNASSDKRLKENIKSFKCEKSILDLPIYTFNFKSDKNKIKHIGCLAQDLQEICPELVHENKDGYLNIEESKLVYLLLDEVKKLKERLKDLEQ